MGNCTGGKNHGAIVDIDDGDFDPLVLKGLAIHIGAGKGWQFGYCGDCSAPHRWSVAAQSWEPWVPETAVASLRPMGWAALEELHLAVKQRLHGFTDTAFQIPAGGGRNEVDERLRLLYLLDELVVEAKAALR